MNSIIIRSMFSFCRIRLSSSLYYKYIILLVVTTPPPPPPITVFTAELGFHMTIAATDIIQMRISGGIPVFYLLGRALQN